MTDPGVNFVAEPAEVGRSVSVGTYRIDVGPRVGMSISTRPEATAAAAEQRAQLTRAIAQDHKHEKKQRGFVDFVERTSDDTGAVTDRIEAADSLWKEIATGHLDIGTVNSQIGTLLALLQKLDREGRFDEQLRLARALSRLLAVALRWLDLLRSLRETLAAAERHGDKSARAWALHELGTLHLAGNDLPSADRELSRASELRKELGDTRGLAATERNLHVLCRTLRQMMRDGRMTERRSPRRLLHVPFVVMAALFLVVFAAATAAIAKIGPFSGGSARAAVVRTVDRILPSSGPSTGNTVVTISGTRLENALVVKFGANDGTHLRQLSGSRLRVTTPPGSASVSVTVETAHGSSVPSAAAHFTYVAPARPATGGIPPKHGSQTGGGSTTDGNTGPTVPAKPTITGITPPSGPATGHIPIVIEGTGLANVSSVTFGDNPVHFEHDGDTGLRVLTPPGSGTAIVTVTTAAGMTASRGFTYVAAPTIASISPPSATPGTTVTITGTGLATASAAAFGDASVSVNPSGDTSLTVTVPPVAASRPCDASVPVTVTSRSGTSNALKFLYECPPG
jgi:hypothetical protein